MDNPVPVQPSTNIDFSPENKKSKKILLFEIASIVISLILILGVLNYFNILPLSKLLPNKKPQPMSLKIQPFPTAGKNNFPTIPFKISCPAIKEFCNDGSGVIKDGKYVGLGGILASGSAIFAAFDGELTATNSAYYSTEIEGEITEQRFKILTLDNQNLKLKAAYYVKGQILKLGKVNKDDQIAISNGKTIGFYDKKSLIFSLVQGASANIPVFLSKQNFE